ncbi:MAG: nuclear transport factor 2 family protein [Balneolaceae bacterium]
MKILFTLTLLVGLSLPSLMAQVSCLDSERLKSLDLKWEEALKESDASFFESLLVDDFIWVHNHASSIDTKESLIKRSLESSSGATGNPRSRISKDVETIIVGSTGVITGFTIVDRGSAPILYNFMRTYVEIEGKCFLVANHTMDVPESTD